MNERGDEWRRVWCDCLTKSTLKLISSIRRLRLLLKTHAISYLPTVLLPCLCAEIVSTHTPMLCWITEAVALPWSRTPFPFTTKVNNHTVHNTISSWFSGNILKCTPTRLKQPYRLLHPQRQPANMTHFPYENDEVMQLYFLLWSPSWARGKYLTLTTIPKRRDNTIPLKNTNHCRSFSKQAFLSTPTEFFETVTSTARSVNA